MLEIALLGTGGMMPLPNRYLTSLLVRQNGKLLMIDCGEGTQVTNKILGWGFKNIDVICITHFHADHISGLPGLLLTIGNSGRTEPLTMIGPKGLQNIVISLCVIATELPFDIEVIEIEEEKRNIKISEFNIDILQLNHRIKCFGYSISLGRVGKFDMEKANKNEVPKNLWGQLQKFNEVIYKNKLYKKDMVLGPDRKGIKVTYTTDTRPTEEMIEFAKNSDLYICEGLHGDNEKIQKVKEHKHMTFLEAANIAKEANVKELWLTHFSPALVNPDMYIEETKKIFPNTYPGFDRKNVLINFEEE